MYPRLSACEGWVWCFYAFFMIPAITLLEIIAIPLNFVFNTPVYMLGIIFPGLIKWYHEQVRMMRLERRAKIVFKVLTITPVTGSSVRAFPNPDLPNGQVIDDAHATLVVSIMEPMRYRALPAFVSRTTDARALMEVDITVNYLKPLLKKQVAPETIRAIVQDLAEKNLMVHSIHVHQTARFYMTAEHYQYASRYRPVL